ncbi:hypothetical protein Ocin01_07232 [Orchesella cincta]|uniref:Uncharacterized protein n=1 Tax=Orchesella cincta TaxID=48709 RepID=A0A1D2N2C5_ORCCI|nr:hypothetical protein Ocin01_07232 [Orchesella cincta]
MGVKSAYFGLFIVIFFVTKSGAFNVPPYNKEHDDGGLSDKNNSDEWLDFHGLNYDYNMESWSSRNGTSNEYTWSESEEGDSQYVDSDEYAELGHTKEPITIGTPTNDSIIIVEEKSQDKNRTVEVPETKESNEKNGDVSSGVSIEVQWTSSATGTSKNETDNMAKEKFDQDIDYSSIVYWDQDGGPDNDDEDYSEVKETPTTTSTEKVKLPSDNDADADKLFNPEKYQALEALHQIEDAILGQWTVLYSDTSLPCIMLKGKISFIVPVSTSWTNRDYVELDVPYDAKASGSCELLTTGYQEIVLKWNVTESNKTYLNTLSLGFGTNWTSEYTDVKIPEDKYALVAVSASYYKGEVTEQSQNSTGDQGLASYDAHDLTEFMTPMNHSMSCYRERSIILGRMQLSFTDIQFEAFRPNLETLPVGDFQNSVLCSTDEIIVFDAVMTFIIWFWIGALFVVLVIFVVLLSLSYRRKAASGGFGYKILSA